MDESAALRDKMYETYLEFFEVAERKRRWNIFDDVPWDQLDQSLNSERKATRIETYCAEEFYLPDYTAGGVELSRKIFGAAWFQACWSYEESKHGLVFREYLTRSGMRSASQFAQFESSVFASKLEATFSYASADGLLRCIAGSRDPPRLQGPEGPGDRRRRPGA
jgi:acyl-[acyl-carrier-protein] desaturase